MRGVRNWGEVRTWPAAAALCAALGVCPAWGDDFAFDGLPAPARFEVWSGAQGYQRDWSIYAGVTTAPFGAIQQDGLRLRVVGGWGATGNPMAGSVAADASFADALLGYQVQAGQLTVKAFAGLAVLERYTRAGGAAPPAWQAVGGKVQLETWLNLGDRAWSALDVAWGSADRDYGGRLRLGWRLLPELSVGLDSSAVGNADCDIVRAALFVRYETASGELSISGGVANDGLIDGRRAVTDPSGPFAMLSWLTRF